MLWNVYNQKSGLFLGCYEASSPEAAIREMMVDAGCQDEPSTDLVAVEVEAD